MITLNIRFTAGRYHATPWGRHVNEGIVEWPPSPWRVLRGLIAVWHRKFSDEVPEPVVRSIIEKLTASPLFHLPDAALGHTRHFMPQKDPLGGDKTKVFDAFVLVSPDTPLTIIWPDVVLKEGELLALKRLISGFGYLGRAESWTSMEVVDQWDGVYNCEPVEEGKTLYGERVRVLGAMTPEQYAVWAKQNTLQVVGAPGPTRSRGRKKEPAALIPPDIWNALHAETSTLQKEGWSAAPGSHWIDYIRPVDSFQGVYQRRSQVKNKSLPNTARFALSGPVLPKVTDTLFIGERIRQGLMAKSRNLNDTEHALPIFSGKTADGKPLTGNHLHAFYLPTDENCDGKIDHITVYASKGFDEKAQTALGQMQKLWGSGGHDIYTVLIGLGQREDYGGFDVRRGQAPQLAESSIWISSTPYLITRHPKKNGKDAPEAQLRKELVRHGFPEPIKIDPIDGFETISKKIRWLEFRRIRTNGGGKLANPRGHGFRIEFHKPVRGPIALGYGCHFGLGQFIPIEE